jgi:uncharacterized protein
MTNSVGGDILQRFLLSDATPQDSMTLCELDGFLTGVAAGPEAVPMEEWSPVVWGSGAPHYRNAEQRKLILNLLARRYADIANLLEGSSKDKTPVYAHRSDEGIFMACTWTGGFLQAMELRGQAWLPLLQDRDMGIFLLPLMTLYRESAEDYDLPFSPALAQAMVSNAAALLPTCARRIKQFWRDRGQDAHSTRSSTLADGIGAEPSAAETATMPFPAGVPHSKLTPLYSVPSGSVPQHPLWNVTNKLQKSGAGHAQSCHDLVSSLPGERVLGAGAISLADRALLPTSQHKLDRDGAHGLEAVMITDPMAVILSVNDAFTRITGYAFDEVVGKTPRILKSSLTSPQTHASFWRQLSNEGRWHGLVWNRSRSGEPFQIMQTVTLVRNAMDQPSGYISVFQKIDGHHILACGGGQRTSPR